MCESASEAEDSRLTVCLDTAKRNFKSCRQAVSRGPFCGCCSKSDNKWKSCTTLREKR